jgi:hypothetical protein
MTRDGTSYFVRSGIRPVQGRPQYGARYSCDRTLTSTHLHDSWPRALRQFWEGLHKNALSGVTTRKNQSQIDSAPDQAIVPPRPIQPSWILVCSVQPLPDMFPHSAPELRPAETTTSASQLKRICKHPRENTFRESRYLLSDSR